MKKAKELYEGTGLSRFFLEIRNIYVWGFLASGIWLGWGVQGEEIHTVLTITEQALNKV